MGQRAETASGMRPQIESSHQPMELLEALIAVFVGMVSIDRMVAARQVVHLADMEPVGELTVEFREEQYVAVDVGALES